MGFSLSQQTGQLLTVGFPAGEPGPELRKLLAAGQRGGLVRFRRNIPSDVLDLAAHNADLAALAPHELPLLIAVDQEGGRVARIGRPLLQLPAARVLAQLGEEGIERAAFAQAQDLRDLGFTMNFAPVLDVDSEPQNPIIGDRAFGCTPHEVTTNALAFFRGMRRAGLLGCGKHAPGHGATVADSHLELPIVARSRASLTDIDFPPFAAASRAGIDALMTAHVLYTDIDAAHPATLSPEILQKIVRRDWQFEGVVFSDDLEMKALAAPVEAAIASIYAGADALLVCSDEGLAARVHEALITEAERAPVFRARVEQSFERVVAMKRRVVVAPNASRLRELEHRHDGVTAELARLV